jgi:hypothetical protein
VGAQIIVARIKAFALEHRRPPKQRELPELGVTLHEVKREFGSFGAAVVAAGYDRPRRGSAVVEPLASRKAPELPGDELPGTSRVAQARGLLCQEAGQLRYEVELLTQKLELVEDLIKAIDDATTSS